MRDELFDDRVQLVLAEALEQDLHRLLHIDRAAAVLVVHHKLDDVEKTPRLPARLVVAQPRPHGLEGLERQPTLAVLVDLPQHVLDVVDLVFVELEFLPQILVHLLVVDAPVLFVVESLEDANERLGLLLLLSQLLDGRRILGCAAFKPFQT